MKSDWLSKPLCCRYAFAEFKTLCLPVQDGDAVKHVSWHWALGLFRPDQYEILGAWPAATVPAWVARDLHERGVESIKAVSPKSSIDCTLQYADAVRWSAAHEPGRASAPANAPAFGPRRRAALQAAVSTAERLQAGMMRAIKRVAPFADEAAATAFLTQTLQIADRRFYETPRTRRRAAPRPVLGASRVPDADSTGA